MQESEPTGEPFDLEPYRVNPENPEGDQEEAAPERITKGIICNGGEQIRDAWSSENLENDDLDEYIEKMRHASGHFAVHGVVRPDLATGCLKRGFIRATAKEGSPPEGYSAAVSNAVHFCVDDEYWGIGEIGLVCSVEALLENKTFMDSPITQENKPNEDWPTSGSSDDPEDESDKFYFDKLGVALIPREIRGNSHLLEEYEKVLRRECGKLGIEGEFFETEGIILPTYNIPAKKIFERIFEVSGQMPKRVYFYEGRNLKEGVNDFLQKNNLRINSNEIQVSGNIKLSRKSPSNETVGSKGVGDFYAIE